MDTPNKNLSELRESNEKILDPEQLDNLFEAIGWKRRGPEKWKEVLTKSSHVFSIKDGDQVIGIGRFIEDGVMCMFYDIGVHPKYQGRGIGSKILKNLVEQVKDKGYASIGLFAWEENPGNFPFYEKFGFVRQSSGMELVKYMKRE
ncbi:MAG: GNAT family N-acetyltransferase [Candidatus Abawacabacteria bacterium]|nr:GNAT family N-acetyltransferase [Candidatus Abawacabacteria bacterium]